jgi:acid phosphatase family membrane protein YuiD
MSDAVKVRMVTQEQSIVLNKLTQGKPGFKKLSEHVGHKPIEVFVSFVLGIIIPIIVYAVF